MSRHAVVCSETHVVTNVVVWDGVTPYAPEGCLLVAIPEDSPVDIGYSYENEVFSPPQEG